MSSACHLPSGRSRSDSFTIRTLEQSTEAVKKYNPQMRPLVSKVLLPFLAHQLSNHVFFCRELGRHSCCGRRRTGLTDETLTGQTLLASRISTCSRTLKAGLLKSARPSLSCANGSLLLLCRHRTYRPLHQLRHQVVPWASQLAKREDLLPRISK